MTHQDQNDFMSEPSPFDHDDYADADAFYARRRYAGGRLPGCRSRAEALRDAQAKSAGAKDSGKETPHAL